MVKTTVMNVIILTVVAVAGGIWMALAFSPGTPTVLLVWSALIGGMVGCSIAFGVLAIIQSVRSRN